MARCVMGGSEYSHPDQLIQAAVTTALVAADGDRGRRWPVKIPFLVFLKMTMKGLAHDSRVHLERMRPTSDVRTARRDPDSAEDEEYNILEFRLPATPSFEQVAIEKEERADRRYAAHADSARLLKYFKRKPKVMAIIAGLAAGKRGHEIWEQAGLSKREYESAQRCLRRGVEKLFPGRTKS
jgi:hypothetical protein